MLAFLTQAVKDMKWLSPSDSGKFPVKVVRLCSLEDYTICCLVFSFVFEGWSKCLFPDVSTGDVQANFPP